MTSSRERILQMVADGSVSADEAEQLLSALDGPKPRAWWLLLNPFAKMGAALGLALALVAAAVSIWLSTLDIRFDGLLDIHRVKGPVSLLTGALDQLASWIVAALVFWLVTIVARRRARIIDLLVGVGVARIPMAISGLAAGLFLPRSEEIMQAAKGGAVAPELLLTIAITLPCLVWFVALLFFGFRTASGFKGAKLAASFIGALVAAETLSKLLIYGVFA